MIPAIEIDNLYFKYNGQKDYILKGINLSVKQGEILAIVGLSGNGKSTLCYTLNGIIPNTFKGDFHGSVKILGNNVKDTDRAELATIVGVVFQDPDTQLFSPTVEDEIAFGPENLCVSREEIGQRIEEVLKLIDMERYRYENPNNLSGGEKQLIALGAVLSLEPDILVFDEAMAQIDEKGKGKIKNVIKKLKEDGKTIVMIEHDFNNLDIVDRIVLLKDGKIQEFKGEL
ncbi:energy-coupling factor ABC transporter ATP-binding protein [Paramaledivibacter caminithermalis]|uniref:Energy-coupling factor transport system ATP-binding protein n=1 Tax=Paramaledivibacter caminithermalis (strain DSM 15212 / CIP 107654 / DViRD3) TaxID=1121301 RepID=A0A1M6QSF0_PARC5|nr:ABC transporter ATP-binding protein [Paramaledivibacter caminithermalis]SHK23212.1 energy-coupling factor transport system ATP-binding protein [Paramaledivibacter caminithermalis DSM 15212]